MEEIIFNERYEHPFVGKEIVFTGALQSMTRIQAAKKARALGANVAGAVTKETDFVVLGKKRPTKSSKQKKAEQYIALGVDIQLIEEQDFLWLLEIR